MPTGPFDRRSRRSRCSACASSHLKCDGASPCNNCQRRNVACTYHREKLLIKLDESKMKTIVSFSNRKQTQSSAPTPQVLVPSLSTLSRYLYYFDIFVQRNNFVASTASYDLDVKSLLGTEPGCYLVHAVTALGALQSSRLSLATSHDDSRTAIKAYSSSVVALREAMAQLTAPSRLHVLWTTLLLGVFELMNSESGDGWLVHMVHGTGAALQASGPSSCMSGPGQSFFLQARVFEVSRALLLGESTFLSNPEWIALSESIRANGRDSHRSLDALLDLIVRCSNLRVKTGLLTEKLEYEAHDSIRYDAEVLAMEGLQLRLALNGWRERWPLPWGPDASTLTASDANTTALSNIFFAAISIYLSGVFDYEVLHWRNWGLSVPTLQEDQVQRHVQTILELVRFALSHTTISPLLFLFSLRIAGARSYDWRRREEILDLLTKIGEQFTIANVFKTELGYVWQAR
ncbi:hypothetical protein NLU13_6900 [Sarocladium strictum]|uniref:Zn(2)-C6 fungal-type domain-containing protein n=1 Tax=Sarocladium strictum TaxID=5046 RepID=A0AA39GFG5_SARSR|nr:hypothetical protein NLU13_6900 [Sarocladium strictum]